MAPPKPGQHRFLGRQAILDRKMDLYGYELLFRAGRVNAFSGDPEDATNQTIDLVTLVIASQLAHSVVDRDSQQAVERACFCESLAPVLHESPAELYMVGMLSMMDRMLNIPMKRLLELISVDSHIQEALLGSAKGLGRALELCRYHEQGGDSQGLIHPDAFVHDCFAEVGQGGAQFQHSGGVDL